MMIGLQKLIAETVDERRTGAAQGAAFFSNGMCMAVVTLLSGPLYHRLGAWGFFAMVAVALLGTLLVWLSVPQPQRSGAGGETSEPS
jgi:PPP family 3-phenylpropionic acid transporter